MTLDKVVKALRDIISPMKKKETKKEVKEVVVPKLDPSIPENKQREFR